MSLFRLGFDGIFELVRNEIPWLLWITSIVTWACWGSFLQAVSYRIPNGVSIVVPESHCPGCKKKLLFQDNLPIIGWLTLHGKCRFCHMVIPIQYLWVEVFMGLLGALFCWITLFEMNDPITWLWALMVTSWLVVLGLIDLNHRLLPDGVVLPPLILGTLMMMPMLMNFQRQPYWYASILFWLIYPYLFYHAIRGLIGVFFGEQIELKVHDLYENNKWIKIVGFIVVMWLVTYVFLQSGFTHIKGLEQNYLGLCLAIVLLYTTRFIASKLAGQEAMGLGDVKMAMVLGWWFGPLNLVLILGFACIFGVFCALIQKLRKKTAAQPFGTMMAISAFLIGVCFELLWPIVQKHDWLSLL